MKDSIQKKNMTGDGESEFKKKIKITRSKRQRSHTPKIGSSLDFK